jgi:hypothetical protein
MLSIRESFAGALHESVSRKWTVLWGRDFAVERLTREIAERSLNTRDISTQGPCIWRRQYCYLHICTVSVTVYA